VKDPDHYLTFREVKVPCAVHPTRRAQLIPAMRAQLNHEIFYFSGAEALQQFRKHPTRYCGYLTDPVSTVRFRPTAKSAHLEFGGRAYYFQSDSTRRSFQSEPEKYAERTGA
jgi:YHS domain-containing protein